LLTQASPNVVIVLYNLLLLIDTILTIRKPTLAAAMYGLRIALSRQRSPTLSRRLHIANQGELVIVVLACYDTITADLSKQGRMNKLFGSIFD